MSEVGFPITTSSLVLIKNQKLNPQKLISNFFTSSLDFGLRKMFKKYLNYFFNKATKRVEINKVQTIAYLKKEVYGLINEINQLF
jgi:hypothetical protein